MSTITSISVISIPVTDQQRARDFYVDILGFEVVSEADFRAGAKWIQLRPQGGGTSITLVTWFDGFEPGSLRGNVLEIEGTLETAMADLESRGVSFAREDIMDSPWGRFAGFADPDGNRWTLRQDVAGD